MAHNNIQYSEKYYDDVYEYRCGSLEPSQACLAAAMVLTPCLWPQARRLAP